MDMTVVEERAFVVREPVTLGAVHHKKALMEAAFLLMVRKNVLGCCCPDGFGRYELRRK